MPLPKKSGIKEPANIDMKAGAPARSSLEQATSAAKAKKKLERDRNAIRKLPSNYVGGIDPLGILGLYLSAIPLIGLLICLLSLRNYSKYIYDDGKYLPLIGLVVNVLILAVIALSSMGMLALFSPAVMMH